jgi:hypothetical protein
MKTFATHPASLMLALLLSLLAGCGGGSVTAPVTMEAPSVSGTTGNATTLSVTIDENGTGYYLVQAAAAAAPSIAAVQAGTSFAMMANVAATPAISGLTPSTAYTIYFVAKDAANNVQAAVQNVAVTTASYVSQGGLTWMPISGTSYDLAGATALCAGTINGQTGWRLPTKDELVSLYNSGAAAKSPKQPTMNDQGWSLFGWVWSSTPGDPAACLGDSSCHYAVGLNNGVVGNLFPYPPAVTAVGNVSCVR